MPVFAPIPLGQTIPPKAHAVSCSLPTMADVVGYEEKDPNITRHLHSGYPRFLLHRDITELTAELTRELGLSAQTLWLTCSPRMATALAAELHPARCEPVNHHGISGVAHPESADLFQHAKCFLQNVGGFLSSRHAEDELVRRGLRPAAASEDHASLDTAGDTIRNVLVQAHAGAAPEDILLAPSGMNAFHAAWRTLADLQATRGRTVWIQFGWLYLDTIAQLKRFAPTDGDYVGLTDVNDLDALEAAIASAGDRLAGLVTEVPTNPLVHTADIAEVARRIHGAGGRMLLDPTLVSPFNIRLLEHADVVVNSLTKYAANQGDVIAGSVILNPHGPDADELRQRIARQIDPIYPRDLTRLAAQIGDYEPTVMRTNESARAVVDFLQAHPAVKSVFWSRQPATQANYLKIARSPGHIGSMISFTTHKPLATVYDALPLPKGPSFGMRNTLVCPYIYLAHYDLITSEAGRAELAAAGLDPDLLRLSVGTEPAEEIITALRAGLDA